MDWLRLYHGTVNDPKWRLVAADSGQPVHVVLAIWMTMLEHASCATPRGTLAGWNDRVIGAGLDLSPDTVSAVRQAMQGLVLDGEYLTGWSKRQPKREDSSTERVRAHRERTVTQRNAAPGAETLDKSREEKNAEAIASDAPSAPPDLKSQLFGPCLRWLAKHSGKTEAQCRPIMAKWLRDHGEPAVVAAFAAHSRAPPPIDAVSAVASILNGKAGKNGRNRTEEQDRRAILAGLADELEAGGPSAGRGDPTALAIGYHGTG